MATPERKPENQPGSEGLPHRPSFSLKDFNAGEKARAAQLRPPAFRQFIQRVRGVLGSLFGRADS